MKKSKLRFLSALLLVMVCCTGFTTVAYAGGGPEAEETIETPEPTAESGEPLSEGSGIVTRDLLYDKATNKQFLTIQDREGNIFYLVIDYDAPVNEDEEQYQTYFLNPVDLSDLEALAEESEEEPVACTCTDKCYIGSVDTACPVCAADLHECAGKEPELTEPEPTTEPAEETEPEETGGNPASSLLIVLLLVALAGGGAFAYIKFIKNKPKAKSSPDFDDYDFEDDEDEENEGEALEESEPDMEDDTEGAESEDE